MKILVVDDDRDFTNKQCEWLKKENYDAIGFYSEREAKDYLSEKSEDIGIVLIDMYMETKDSGLKLIGLIRKSYPWVVPIVITGHADLENAARCMENGCFSYIVKGESPDMIRQIIMKAVDHHRYLTVLPRLKSALKDLGEVIAEFDTKMKKMSSILQRIEDEFRFFMPKQEA